MSRAASSATLEASTRGGLTTCSRTTQASACSFAKLAESAPGDTTSQPRLFLELKNTGYTVESVAKIWEHVEELGIENKVALWAMDRAHYQILKGAAEGRVQVVWGYLDQHFADVVSTVPFPAPVPPPIAVRPLHDCVMCKRRTCKSARHS